MSQPQSSPSPIPHQSPPGQHFETGPSWRRDEAAPDRYYQRHEGLTPGSKAAQAGKLVGSIAKLCGGGGGGRPNLAQAGGRQPEQIPEALEAAKKAVVEALEKL